MIAEFKFGYSSITEDKNETIDGKVILKERTLLIPSKDYDSLREILPDLPKDPIAERVSPWEHYIADIDLVLQYVNSIEIIRPIRKMGTYDSILNMAEKVLEKMKNIEKMNEQLFNRKVEVHVPGNSLLKIDEIEVLQDACTDEIQRHLSKGWRILSVCPQPDQRRPDYILGRESD